MNLSTEALNAGWTRRRARLSGLVYFYNENTKESQWSLPQVGTMASKQGDKNVLNKVQSLEDDRERDAQPACGVHHNFKKPPREDDYRSPRGPSSPSEANEYLSTGSRPIVGPILAKHLPTRSNQGGEYLQNEAQGRLSSSQLGPEIRSRSPYMAATPPIGPIQQKVSSALSTCSASATQIMDGHLSYKDLLTTPRLLDQVSLESHQQSVSRILHSRRMTHDTPVVESLGALCVAEDIAKIASQRLSRAPHDTLGQAGRRSEYTHSRSSKSTSSERSLSPESMGESASNLMPIHEAAPMTIDNLPSEPKTQPKSHSSSHSENHHVPSAPSMFERCSSLPARGSHGGSRSQQYGIRTLTSGDVVGPSASEGRDKQHDARQCVLNSKQLPGRRNGSFDIARTLSTDSDVSFTKRAPSAESFFAEKVEEKRMTSPLRRTATTIKESIEVITDLQSELIRGVQQDFLWKAVSNKPVWSMRKGKMGSLR